MHYARNLAWAVTPSQFDTNVSPTTQMLAEKFFLLLETEGEPRVVSRGLRSNNDHSYFNEGRT
jgi:hypothetical protein